MGTPNRMHELVYLVAEMRLAQIEYFRFRTTPEKERAKKLERELDPILTAIGDRGPHLQTDVRELAALARDMRSTQRAFSSRWNRDLMGAVKQVEKKLDRALAAIGRESLAAIGREQKNQDD